MERKANIQDGLERSFAAGSSSSDLISSSPNVSGEHLWSNQLEDVPEKFETLESYEALLKRLQKSHKNATLKIVFHEFYQNAIIVSFSPTSSGETLYYECPLAKLTPEYQKHFQDALLEDPQVTTTSGSFFNTFLEHASSKSDRQQNSNEQNISEAGSEGGNRRSDVSDISAPILGPLVRNASKEQQMPPPSSSMGASDGAAHVRASSIDSAREQDSRGRNRLSDLSYISTTSADVREFTKIPIRKALLVSLERTRPSEDQMVSPFSSMEEPDGVAHPPAGSIDREATGEPDSRAEGDDLSQRAADASKKFSSSMEEPDGVAHPPAGSIDREATGARSSVSGESRRKGKTKGTLFPRVLSKFISRVMDRFPSSNIGGGPRSAPSLAGSSDSESTGTQHFRPEEPQRNEKTKDGIFHRAMKKMVSTVKDMRAYHDLRVEALRDKEKPWRQRISNFAKQIWEDFKYHTDVKGYQKMSARDHTINAGDQTMSEGHARPRKLDNSKPILLPTARKWDMGIRARRGSSLRGDEKANVVAGTRGAERSFWSSISRRAVNVMRRVRGADSIQGSENGERVEINGPPQLSLFSLTYDNQSTSSLTAWAEAIDWSERGNQSARSIAARTEPVGSSERGLKCVRLEQTKELLHYQQEPEVDAEVKYKNTMWRKKQLFPEVAENPQTSLPSTESLNRSGRVRGMVDKLNAGTGLQPGAKHSGR